MELIPVEVLPGFVVVALVNEAMKFLQNERLLLCDQIMFEILNDGIYQQYDQTSNDVATYIAMPRASEPHVDTNGDNAGHEDPNQQDSARVSDFLSLPHRSNTIPLLLCKTMANG